ncbi:hypothetical protein BDV18DRAFT_159110 [Aspergillus unguis]
MALRELCNAVKSLTTRDPNREDWHAHSQTQVRGVLLDEVSQLFDHFYYSLSPTIDPAVLTHSALRIEPLELVTDGAQPGRHFLKPRPAIWLASHPVDRLNEQTQDRIAWLEDKWTADTNIPNDFADSGLLSGTLSYEFRYYERKIGPGAETYTLEEMTGWVPRPLVRDIQHNKYMQPSPPSSSHTGTAAFSKTRFGDSWLRDDATPHITCILEHGIPPEEHLLRSEVLTILGLIRSRLAGYTLQENKIIPVNVISCMSGYAARVLQAWYIDEELVVCKSKYYYFDTLEERRENMKLFLLYLGSEPVGDTRACY